MLSGEKRLFGVSSFNIILISLYHPNENENEIIFTNYLSTVYLNLHSSTILISGQDLNCCSGSKSKNYISVETCGLKKTNEKEIEAINLLRYFNLKVTLTFMITNINHLENLWWKNTTYQPDQWIVNSLSHVKDSYIIDYDVYSDHYAIKVALKLKNILKKFTSLVNSSSSSVMGSILSLIKSKYV